MPIEDRPVRTLIEWRKRIPETQKEFAKRLGVNIRTLQAWEQGVNRPRPSAHRALAKKIHVEPWQISFDRPHADLPKAEDAPAA